MHNPMLINKDAPGLILMRSNALSLLANVTHAPNNFF